MNIREDDHVSAVALVVESDGSTAAAVTDEALADGPLDLSADSGDTLPDGVVDDDLAEGADGADADRRTRRPRGRGLRRRTARRRDPSDPMLGSPHQRKEVVHICSHSSCGTLEVTGR